MPYCPRCSSKLRKRVFEGSKSYHCVRHGFVREIRSPPSTGISDEEFDRMIEAGEMTFKKSIPLKVKPKPKINLLSGDINRDFFGLLNNLEIKKMNKTTKKKGAATAFDVQVGERIRSCRLGAGLSQEELANKLGLTFQQIQKYEKGTNRAPSLRIVQMSNIFKVSIGFLLLQEDGPVQPQDRDEAALLTAFRKMPEAAKKQVISLIINITQILNKE